MYKYVTSQLKYFDNVLKNIILEDYKSIMSTEKKDFVAKAIKSDRVVIFSKASCPFCKMAKECFEKLNCKYTAIELDTRDDCDEIQDILEELTGTRTVPKVYVNEKFIGGGSDTKKLYANGELKKLVEA